MSQHAAILDVGSSKIVCLDCSPAAKGNLVVHGAGIAEYKGYRHGAFLDEKDLQNAVLDAVTAARRESKRHLRQVAVGVPAPFTRLELVPAEMEVTSRSGKVSAEDVDELIAASLDFEQPEGFDLMHSTPVEFLTDKTPRRDMPVGITAKTLGGTISHMYVDSRFKQLITDALDADGIEADMFVGAALASSLFMIPEQARQSRAVLIDVGYTHTDISLISNTGLIRSVTLEIGGRHFAGDLAYALNIPLAAAENVKRRYVYSLDYQDSIDNIRIPGGSSIRVEHSAIQYILEERASELADMILNTLLDMHVLTPEPASVYLTGGGLALMRGSSEFMERRLGLELKSNMPWMPRLSSPNYASAFGVMEFVLRADAGENPGVLAGMAEHSKIAKKIMDFFIK